MLPALLRSSKNFISIIIKSIKFLSDKLPIICSSLSKNQIYLYLTIFFNKFDYYELHWFRDSRFLCRLSHLNKQLSPVVPGINYAILFQSSVV